MSVKRYICKAFQHRIQKKRKKLSQEEKYTKQRKEWKERKKEGNGCKAKLIPWKLRENNSQGNIVQTKRGREIRWGGERIYLLINI